MKATHETRLIEALMQVSEQVGDHVFSRPAHAHKDDYVALTNQVRESCTRLARYLDQQVNSPAAPDSGKKGGKKKKKKDKKKKK